MVSPGRRQRQAVKRLCRRPVQGLFSEGMCNKLEEKKLLDYALVGRGARLVPKWLLSVVGSSPDFAVDCRSLGEGELIDSRRLAGCTAYATVFWMVACCISIVLALVPLVIGWAANFRSGGQAIAVGAAIFLVAVFLFSAMCYGIASVRTSRLLNSSFDSVRGSRREVREKVPGVPISADFWISLSPAALLLIGYGATR